MVTYIARQIAHGPCCSDLTRTRICAQWLPDRLKLHAHRSLPMACALCSTEDNKLYHRKLNVFHGERKQLQNCVVLSGHVLSLHGMRSRMLPL